VAADGTGTVTQTPQSAVFTMKIGGETFESSVQGGRLQITRNGEPVKDPPRLPGLSDALREPARLRISPRGEVHDADEPAQRAAAPPGIGAPEEGSLLFPEGAIREGSQWQRSESVTLVPAGNGRDAIQAKRTISSSLTSVEIRGGRRVAVIETVSRTTREARAGEGHLSQTATTTSEFDVAAGELIGARTKLVFEMDLAALSGRPVTARAAQAGVPTSMKGTLTLTSRVTSLVLEARSR